jgi:alpha-D-xyloside xylohydrolase
MTQVGGGRPAADPVAAVLHAWDRRDWTDRDAEGLACPPPWEAQPITIAGHAGWALRGPELAGHALYGSGESFPGLNLAGRRRVLLNRETNGAGGADLAYLNVPFVWSDAGWGLFVDTGAPVLLDARGPVELVVLDAHPAVTPLAGTPRQILEQYTALTGRAPARWPDWAFGVWMSRATYLSAAEVTDVVRDLQSADCPVDVVHIDAWMTGNVFRHFTTNWEADRARFPHGWTDDLRDHGVRVSLWINPYVLQGTPLAQRLHHRGLLLRNPDGSPARTSDAAHRHLVDFTSPDAVRWWGERITDLMRLEKPDALKLDFAEEVPLDAVTADGRSGLELRNAYGTLYQRATADALRARDPSAAVPLFCRSGSSGAQATPAHWVGDTPSTWDGMAAALAGCLSLAASGFALVTHDAGGFHSPGNSDVPIVLLDGGHARYTADVEPELYGRWAQFAAFSPVTRFHGLGLREPSAYPQPWRRAAVEALRARRGIVAVLEGALLEASRTGMPVMRPMALVTDDPDARTADTQYMLGDDVLVAPVLEPGGRTRMWLPPGPWTPLVGRPRLSGDSGWVDVECDPLSFPAFRRSTGDRRPAHHRHRAIRRTAASGMPSQSGR